MATQPITIPQTQLQAETRAAEQREKLIATLMKRVEAAMREVFKGHGENYFDGY